LATARALMGNPRCLLLDEPSEGLAPLVVRELGRLLDRLKEEGLAILLIEQNLGFALKHADTAYIMSKGKIVYHASPKELDENLVVQSRYLGV
jgi:branched-chain amino acid transport system ATP-binding protein